MFILHFLNAYTFSFSGSRGEISRDAASWLREVSALDLSMCGDNSETVSLAASESVTLTSPRDTYAPSSVVNASQWSGTWNDRRPSLMGSHDSYGHNTGSSSSGSLAGDDPGWWASTWASGRSSSMWDSSQGPQSPAPDTFYDTPRSIAGPFPPPPPPASPAIQQNTPPCCASHLLLQHHLQHRQQQQKPFVTPNPMDNYDIPRPQNIQPTAMAYYDTPRRIVKTVDAKSSAALVSTGGDTCGRVLGWAGALVCGTQDLNQDSSEPLKVNGEGRMPVLDANTGILVQPRPTQTVITPIKAQCHFDQTLTCLSQHQNIQSPRGTESPLYAVVDKSKKTSKPRAPTPPPSPPPRRSGPPVTTSAHNYVNLEYNHINAQAGNIKDQNTLCDSCHKNISCSIIDSKNTGDTVKTVKQPLQSKSASVDEEAHYLMMGPGPKISPQDIDNNQSQYLLMSSVRPDTEMTVCKEESPRRRESRPGRSLSLARTDRSSSPTPRRSSSADSRLRESWAASPVVSPAGTPVDTPTGTPIGTPVHKPKVSEEIRGRARRRSPEVAVDSGCDMRESEEAENEVGGPILRRSSSAPGKAANRDSASSNDSGVCDSPRNMDRLLASHCLHASLPRQRRQAIGHQNHSDHHHHHHHPHPNGKLKKSLDLLKCFCLFCYCLYIISNFKPISF